MMQDYDDMTQPFRERIRELKNEVNYRVLSEENALAYSERLERERDDLKREATQRCELHDERIRELETERDDAYRALLVLWSDCLGDDPDIQEQLTELGLLKPIPVTAEMLEQCDTLGCCCDVGCDCYHLTAKASRAQEAALQVLESE